MIQRIQSVFLALIFIVLLPTYFLNFASFNLANSVYTFDIYACFKFNLTEEIKIASHWYLAIVAFAVQIVAIVTVFLFKNRALQMKLCRLNFLLITALLAIQFLLFDKYQTIAIADKGDTGLAINYGLALFTPFLLLLFNFLALRFIKKDEELIRSADRIR